MSSVWHTEQGGLRSATVEPRRGSISAVLVALLPLSVCASQATSGPEDVQVFTVGRLNAFNYGPGKLRAEVSSRLTRNPVLLVTGPSVVFKVDWHYVDQSPVRTLDATVSASVSVFPSDGSTPLGGEQSQRLGSGASPKAVARNAAALEILVRLPREVCLLRAEIAARVVAVTRLAKKDSGWRRFACVLVRTDLLCSQLPAEVASEIGVASGHLTALQSDGWSEDARRSWLAADTATVLERGHGSGGRSPRIATAGPPITRQILTAASRSLERLCSCTDSPLVPARLQDAAELLGACAARAPADSPTHLSRELEWVAQVLETTREQRTRSPVAAPPLPERPAENAEDHPLRPLRNGDFADGLRHWERLGQARGTSPSVEIAVGNGGGATCVMRSSGGLNMRDGGIAQDIGIPVERNPELRLDADVRVGPHTPRGGGNTGAVHPLTLKIRYEDSEGSLHTWSHSFYAEGQAPDGAGATKTTRGEWRHYRSPAMSTLDPKPSRLVRIEIRATGRSFDSAVARIVFR